MTNHMISLMISSTTDPRCLEPLSKLNPEMYICCLEAMNKQNTDIFFWCIEAMKEIKDLTCSVVLDIGGPLLNLSLS
jgi:hypothetical protein